MNTEVDVLVTAECFTSEHPLDLRHLLFLFVFFHVTQQLLKQYIASCILLHLLEMIFNYRNKLVLNLCYFYHLAHKQCFLNYRSGLGAILAKFLSDSEMENGKKQWAG